MQAQRASLPSRAAQTQAVQSRAAGAGFMHGLRPEDCHITAPCDAGHAGGRWGTRVQGREVQTVGDRLGLQWDAGHPHPVDGISHQRLG